MQTSLSTDLLHFLLRRLLGRMLLGGCWLLLPGLVCAQAAAPSPAAVANPLTAALQQTGVVRCAPQIQKVTDFLTSKSRMGSMIFPLAAKPDDSLISISSEITTGNVLTYAGASFAPRSDGCSAVYEQVSHWQNTCDEVLAAQYGNFKPLGLLQQQIKVYSNNPGSRVMMVPAGTGCVVIKKEIVH